MTSIKISNPYSVDSISVSNTFIDIYMPPANGEFVKVYLYLLRAANSGYSPTITDIADALSHTESDILRALKYWENQGLFALIFAENGELATISLLPIDRAAAVPVKKPTPTITPALKNAMGLNGGAVTFAKKESQGGDLVKMPPAKKDYDPMTIEQSLSEKESDEIRDLLYEAETLLNATVSDQVLSTLFYLYNDLKLPIDLIYFAIEYCAELGKHSFRYFEKTALAWYEKNITSVEEAKQMLEDNSAQVSAVKKALGLNTWGEEARVSLQLWINDYKMPLNLIVEACNRAYTKTGGNNALRYVQKTLDNWNNDNIRSLEDLEKSDKAFHAAQKQSAKESLSPSKKAFHNYESRDEIDYDALLNNIKAKPKSEV
ncbi:MAG: DnaD domain protein [Lachnospiraceae bacterium]|nr:DnaD domain protein [Lachnospiraceae bacterium]